MSNHLKELKLQNEILDTMINLSLSREIAEIHPVNKMMVRVWEAKLEELLAERDAL